MKKYGGKAKNLDILRQAGFRVPEFIVIENSVSEEEIMKQVQNKMSDCKYFAVRSSALVEDGTQKSYAGHFYSAVGVHRENLFSEYQNVINSYKGQAGAVIVQHFIPSDKSGVLFTQTSAGNMVVNTNWGLCKTVVEGLACDELISTKKGEIIEKNSPKIKKALYFENSKLIEKIIENKPVLTENELKIIVEIGQKIEKHFGCPQDIEWCFYEDKLYILQARPITRTIKDPPKGTGVFYDSANIAESYSGIVLPLTISFAKHIYKIVYMNLLHASGVSRKKMQKNSKIFDEMVHDFYGRLYYNMNNWYLMMAFVPGYKRNKQNLETMITGNISENIAKKIEPSLALKLFYPLIVIGKLLVLPQSIKNFKKKVTKAIKEFRKLDDKKLSIDDCIQKYRKLDKNLLEKWYVTVENDFMVMTYLGILKKKLNQEKVKNILAFDNKSTGQIDAIKKLTEKIKDDNVLQEAVLKNETEKFEQELTKNKEFSDLLKKYFEEYGGRFANELKLESPDIEEDKSKLFTMFRLYQNFEINKVKKKQEKIHGRILNFALKKFKKYAAKREELRLLRSNCFSIVRKLMNRIGAEFTKRDLIEKSEDIYYLKIEEVFDKTKHNNTEFYRKLISVRKKQYKQFRTVEPLPFFELPDTGEVPMKKELNNNENTIKARACTAGIVKGKVRVFKEHYFPETIDFDIVVASHTDPGWTALIGLSKGLIIEHGGILSHAAIVSRELEIPTVIGAENATLLLKTGQTVELNGNTGTIKIIQD